MSFDRDIHGLGYLLLSQPGRQARAEAERSRRRVPAGLGCSVSSTARLVRSNRFYAYTRAAKFVRLQIQTQGVGRNSPLRALSRKARH